MTWGCLLLTASAFLALPRSSSWGAAALSAAEVKAQKGPVLLISAPHKSLKTFTCPRKATNQLEVLILNMMRKASALVSQTTGYFCFNYRVSALVCVLFGQLCMSKVGQESFSVLWFVCQKSSICGACRNQYSPLEILFLMVGNSWGYSQDRAEDLQHSPSPFLALSAGGVEPPLPRSG